MLWPSVTLPVANRILVIGPPGAGKSSFCKKLASTIKKPLFHLDDYYWLEGWKRVEQKIWLCRLRNLCNQPCWIIDGNHAASFKRRALYADMVIMLDYSPALCFWRFLKRSVRRYFNLKDNLPINIEQSMLNNRQISIQWHLIKLILCYRFLTKPFFLDFLSNIDCPVVLLKSDKASREFLNVLKMQHSKEQ